MISHTLTTTPHGNPLTTSVVSLTNPVPITPYTEAPLMHRDVLGQIRLNADPYAVIRETFARELLHRSAELDRLYAVVNENSSLRNEISMLKKEIEDLKLRNDVLFEQNKAIISENSQLQEQIRVLTTKINNFQSQIERLEERESNSNDQISEFKKENKTLTDRDTALENERASTQAILAWYEFSNLLPRFILRSVYQHNYAKMSQLLFDIRNRKLTPEQSARYREVRANLVLDLGSLQQIYNTIKEFKHPRADFAHNDHQQDKPKNYYYDVAQKLCTTTSKLKSLGFLRTIVSKTFTALGDTPFTTDTAQFKEVEAEVDPYLI